MDALKIAICDDERMEYQILKRILDKNNIPYTDDYYETAEDFLTNFKVGKYDLIFMDIFMTNLDGLNCVERLRKIDSHVPVAFTTSSMNHSLDSYRLHVQRYLVKPLKSEEVLEMCNLALNQRDNQPSIFFKSSGQMLKIPCNHILYAEQQGHNLMLHLVDEQVLQRSGKLDDLETELSLQNFMRTHKSYLVNLEYVTDYNRELSTFTLHDGTQIHISRNNQTAAARYIQERNNYMN